MRVPSDPLRKQGFCAFEFGAARNGEAAASAIDEVVEHAHAGLRPLRRNFSGSESSRNGGGAFLEEAGRRVSRIRLDFANPSIFSRDHYSLLCPALS